MQSVVCGYLGTYLGNIVGPNGAVTGFFSVFLMRRSRARLLKAIRAGPI